MHFPACHLQSTDEDTENLVLDDGSIVHFCTKFKYLGSIFTPDLTDFADINNRIQKASFAFGTLRPLIFAPRFIPLKLKRALYISCVLNILLWGAENWALHNSSLAKLKSFHTKCCRSILGITMWEVASYRVKNANVLKYIGIPPVDNYIHYRRLIWIGKIGRMPFSRFPRKFLTAWTSPPNHTLSRPHGRPVQTIRHSFLNSLNFIRIREKNGNLKNWVRKTYNEKLWTKKCGKLLQVKEISYVEFLNTYTT